MERRQRIKKPTNKKKLKIIIITVITILFIIAATILAIKIFNNSKQETIKTEKPKVIKEKEVEIFAGEDRSIAVMIDNNTNAWPQTGINKAYIIYEIIVEAGETRLMAIFKGQDVDKIGPIRSARHYFLDYALENDAIYAHLGWSPQAQNQISTLGVNNINGQYYETGSSRTTTSKYWRDSSRKAPHNSYTNIAMLLKIAEEKKYRITSKSESVLNYTTKEIELKDGINANTIMIPYNGTNNVAKYIYNSELKRYTRYSKGKKQTEATEGEDITVKNIIITFAENYTLSDGENKGRQDLKNVGILDGYYITNGKAIKIKCEKTARTSQTIYKDLEGNEIKVNDGNTFVQICPINSNVTIEEI